MPVPMPTRYLLPLALVAAGLSAVPAAAQGAAQTGTGGGPSSTITAPNTSSVGQTKPPAAAAGPGPATDHEGRTDQMKKDDKIMKGICIGCGTK